MQQEGDSELLSKFNDQLKKMLSDLDKRHLHISAINQFTDVMISVMKPNK